MCSRTVTSVHRRIRTIYSSNIINSSHQTCDFTSSINSVRYSLLLVCNGRHHKRQRSLRSRRCRRRRKSQPQHQHQSLASHFHLYPLVEKSADAIETWTRDLNSDSLVCVLSGLTWVGSCRKGGNFGTFKGIMFMGFWCLISGFALFL